MKITINVFFTNENGPFEERFNCYALEMNHLIDDTAEVINSLSTEYKIVVTGHLKILSKRRHSK